MGREIRTGELIPLLDLLILERLDTGLFVVVEAVPNWFGQLCPDLVFEAEGMKLEKRFPFLENYLVDADEFWRTRTEGKLTAGTWSERDSSGKLYHLDASAFCLGDRRLLVIELLGEAHEERQLVLQKARDKSLDYERLMRAEEKLEQMNLELESSRNDLVSILNQLRVGTAMTDRNGTISFLSESAARIFGKGGDEVLKKHWQQVFPFQRSDKAQLKVMSEIPIDERKKIPVHLEAAGGRHYWMEVDVHDDPNDRDRKIFFIYDVSEVQDLRRLLDEKAQFQDLVGKSDPMRLVYQQIRDVAKVDTTILIEGETGTGKELVARAIHFSSPRSNNPFIAVNCAGLTESLLGSQLFGHKRGAFTGAGEDHKGFFESAEKGTIFLDEIGDVPLTVQANLLRVLQEREVVRLGETKPRKIDVRVLVATNRDLNEEVEKGNFRADLLYRVRVARTRLPPLRRRREDIPLLVAWFLGQSRAATGKPVLEVSQEAMRVLMSYDWPGNVRELKSAIEFAVIQCKGTVIHPEDLPPEIVAPKIPFGDEGEMDEKERILAALKSAGGNRARASRLLGISRATLYRHLKKFDIESLQ